MRSKYKVGDLIEFKMVTDTSTQIVTGVLFTSTGRQYRVNDGSFVNESDIVNVYRAVKTRRSPTKKTTQSKTTTETTMTQ